MHQLRNVSLYVTNVIITRHKRDNVFFLHIFTTTPEINRKQSSANEQNAISQYTHTQAEQLQQEALVTAKMVVIIV